MLETWPDDHQFWFESLVVGEDKDVEIENEIQSVSAATFVASGRSDVESMMMMTMMNNAVAL